MNTIDLILLSVALAMDAFAVALCKGLAIRDLNLKKCLTVGLWFGAFQGGMPLIGFLLGVNFSEYIQAYDHWIAFVLLGLIGGNMIKEAFSNEEDKEDDSLNFKSMIVLSIATSIDALAVGVTFAFLQVNIVIAVLSIGIITFTLSAIGVKLGSIFGYKFKSKAEIFGGVVLIIIGTKILLEHLNII